MPIDSSIYSLIQPQRQPDLMQQAGGMLQMKQLMGQGQLQDMQRAEMEAGIAREGQLRDLFSRGRPTAEQVYAIDPKRGADFEKAAAERDKANAAMKKDQAETLLKNATFLRDRAAQVRPGDAAGWRGYLDDSVRLFGPDSIKNLPEVPTPEVLTSLMQKADDLIVPLAKRLELESSARGQNITMRGQDLTASTAAAGQAITQTGQRLADERARSEGALNRGVTQRGQDLADERARAAAAQAKAPTESQARANLFGTRAQEADRILRSLENNVAPVAGAIKESMANVPLVGGLAGAIMNELMPEDYQKVEQAQRDFVNAVLRVESGAVINPDEFKNAKKQYFPQPGDSAAVIEQKRKNRETAIAGLRTMSGPSTPMATSRPTTGQGTRATSGGIKFLGFE